MSNGTKVETQQPITNAMAQVQVPKKRKLLEQLADRYGVEPDVLMRTVAETAMPKPHTQEELISCLIVANEHDWNPLTKEIHFMRTKQGTIQPIAGIDGWVKKLNGHPHFDGMEFDYEREGKDVVSITCRIFMKNRTRPIIATELMEECTRPPAQGKGPNAWSMTPTRMLRHRALMQAARYAVGFGGVMDLDEFERWQEMEGGMKNITPRAAAPLPVPDIDDGTGTSVRAIEAMQSEAEASQDAPFQDPAAYIKNLGEELAAAPDKDALTEIWAAHLEGSDGRLSREHQDEAIAMHEKQLERFSPPAKPATKAKEKLL